MPDFPRPIQRRPAGRAIRRTADERAKVSQITSADVLAARMLWVETAPASHKGLVEAKISPDEDRTPT